MSERSGPPAVRRPGLRLGRVLGVPVYLRYSWLLLAAVVVVLYAGVLDRMLPQLGITQRYAFAVGFVLCLLLSVLLHELGHAVVARHYGITVRAIMLEVLGGYTEMETDSPHPRADLAVSVIGPVVSGVLGGAALGAYVALPEGGVLSQLAFQLAWSNLVVAVFNSLPGLPLDGGRAVRALVWGLTGNRHTGTSVAGWLGRILAVGLTGVAIWLFTVAHVSIATPLLIMMLALTMWQGATIAIVQGRVLARLPRLGLRQLARPVVVVPTGTPLAEAARRAGGPATAGGSTAPDGPAAARTLGGADATVPGAVLAVADTAGRLVALVHEESAAAVPQERRPWVPVDSVARPLNPGGVLDASLEGEDVIKAIRAHPATEYLVVSGSEVVGVFRVADLDKALRS